MNEKLIELSEFSVAFFGKEVGCARFDESGNIITRSFQELNNTKEIGSLINSWLNTQNLTFGFNTTFHTSPIGFTEHTRRLQVSEDVIEMPEELLNQFLISAAQTKIAGLDSKPLFERSWHDYSYLCFRGAKHLYTTEIPRSELPLLSDALVNSSNLKLLFSSLKDEDTPSLNIRIETRTRSLFRNLFITDTNKSQKKSAIVYVTEAGWGYGFYSPDEGIIDEMSESFNMPENSENISIESQYHEVVFDVLTICFERFNELFGETDAVLYFSSSDSLSQLVRSQINEITLYKAFNNQKLNFSLAEGCAAGLLAAETELGNELVPRINMVNDLWAIHNLEIDTAQTERMLAAISYQRKVLAALFVPAVLMIGLFLGLYLDTFRESFSLSRREAAADEEASRLAPIVEDRKSYIENFRWYEAYINQVVDLRSNQSLPLGFFNDLNPRFPLAADNSFYISDMKMGRDGVFEIKGLCREESTITAFVRSLEFSNTGENNQKIFTNLTFEVKQGNQTGGSIGSFSIPSAALPPSSTSIPNVYAWTVKGVYSPLMGAGKTAVVTPAAANLPPSVTTASPVSSPNQ